MVGSTLSRGLEIGLQDGSLQDRPHGLQILLLAGGAPRPAFESVSHGIKQKSQPSWIQRQINPYITIVLCGHRSDQQLIIDGSGVRGGNAVKGLALPIEAGPFTSRIG